MGLGLHSYQIGSSNGAESSDLELLHAPVFCVSLDVKAFSVCKLTSSNVAT